jgi:hypothetical protein
MDDVRKTWGLIRRIYVITGACNAQATARSRVAAQGGPIATRRAGPRAEGAGRALLEARR